MIAATLEPKRSERRLCRRNPGGRNRRGAPPPSEVNQAFELRRFNFRMRRA